ncbi:hypothetical protein AWENTII_006288 [Aspergillus wentii]|nr:hypothetical protein MW887_003085 [Aspergillus wentii]
MGQELANIETLVILACVARRYDWEKVGLGAIERDGPDEPTSKVNGQYEVESEVYNTLEISSKPVDGMRMRVKLAV